MAWRTSIRATSTGFRLRRRVNILFAFWLIASAGWIAIVGIDLCARISDQVAFSQQIGADLARIDCETGNAARCATVAAAPPGYGGSWTEVAGLFLTYGCWTLLEFALAPPAAVLAIGLVAASVARRLRRRVTLPSPASADRFAGLGGTPTAATAGTGD